MWQLVSSEYGWYFYSKIRFFLKRQFFINRLAIAGANEVQIKKKYTKEKEMHYKSIFFSTSTSWWAVYAQQFIQTY